MREERVYVVSIFVNLRASKLREVSSVCDWPIVGADMEFIDAPVPAAPVPAAAEPKKKAEFSEAMLDTLRDVFDEFDQDKSGTISTEEMFSMCLDLDLGLSNEELAKLIKDTDADGSGEIESEAHGSHIAPTPCVHSAPQCH